jgi:signal transduction histidine kinase
VIKKFESLLVALREIEASHDEQQILDALVYHVAELGFPNVFLSKLVTENNRCVIRAIQALGDEWTSIFELTVRPYPGPDLLARVLEEGKARYIADSRTNSENDAFAVARSGIISQFVVPLCSGDVKIGTMQVHMGNRPRRPELECKVLETLGVHVSLAISRLRSLIRLRDVDSQIMHYGKLAIANEVVATVMHQLKPQIAAFRSHLGELLKGRVYRDQGEMKGVLERLRDEVNEWSRKVEAPLKLLVHDEEARNYSLRDLIQETISYWNHDATVRGCKIGFHPYQPDVCAHIRPSQFREVLSCLLVNALQAHARRIKVTLDQCVDRCGLRPEDEDDCAVVTVSDDGTGIPAGLGEDVFKLGFTTKSRGGTGIGLYVASRLATAMSGTLTLTSSGRAASEEETVFKLAIPAEISAGTEDNNG